MQNKVKRRALSTVGAAMLIAALALPQAASASTPDDAGDSTTVYSPMTVGGYDADVAEANGYQIVTNPDGSQQSVPVTEEAKAQQAAADSAKAEFEAQTQAGTVSPMGAVDGDCGSSWIDAIKLANDTVAYDTGYVVFGAVVDSQWEVIASGLVSGSSTVLDAGRNSGTWSTEGALYNVIGPGRASVYTPGSFAILASGQVCYSGGPTSNSYG